MFSRWWLQLQSDECSGVSTIQHMLSQLDLVILQEV
uniref:Uncharacterized protein n=1 Tax=Arundo donax TaxID=35708 RepID=A0A0A9ABU5_ARUDO